MRLFKLLQTVIKYAECHHKKLRRKFLKYIKQNKNHCAMNNNRERKMFVYKEKVLNR